MPTQWHRSAWQAFVAKSEASGDPPGGYLPEKGRSKHADCSSIVDAELCDQLEAKTRERLGAVNRAALEDALVMRSVERAEAINSFPPGWRKIGTGTFEKTANKRVATVTQVHPGRWTAKLIDKRGRMNISSDIPRHGLDLMSALNISESWIAYGNRGFPSSRPGDKLLMFDPPGGNTMKTKSTIGRLIDRTLNAHQSIPPSPVPTPMPAPRPALRPSPEQPALTTRRAIDPASLKNVSDFVKRLLEPLATDVANLRDGDVGAVKATSHVELVNRSIIESGGITGDGRMSPGAAARKQFGLPYPGRQSAYIDRSGQQVEGVHDPRARNQSISAMVRRSLGLAGDGRTPDSRSNFPSRHMPELVFRTRVARDQYDVQIQGNRHDGAVILRAFQQNIIG